MLFVVLLSWACSGENGDSIPLEPIVPVVELPPPNHQQVIMITTTGWSENTGNLSRFEWTEGEGWLSVGTEIEVRLGSAGLGWGIGLYDWPIEEGEIKKTEGDNRSPAGIFALTSSFGAARKQTIQWSLPYQSTHPNLHCVSDIASKHYNAIVNQLKVKRDWNNFEVMRREDGWYKWGIVIGHNPKNTVPEGACIFLFSAQKQQETSGGTLLSERNIISILPWLKQEANPILVQASAEGMPRLLKVLKETGVDLER